MTSSRPNPLSPLRGCAGFTFIELMVAASLSVLVLGAVLTISLMLIKSGMRVGHYSTMESQTRRAFEQLGIDARMASDFTASFSGGQITAFTLTIPNNDLTAVRRVTYGYDTSNPTDNKFFFVPGPNASATAGRVNLITGITALTIIRSDKDDVVIPPSTTSSSGIKHVQISVSVERSGVGVAKATQVIRSSAFTLRNITL